MTATVTPPSRGSAFALGALVGALVTTMPAMMFGGGLASVLVVAVVAVSLGLFMATGARGADRVGDFFCSRWWIAYGPLEVLALYATWWCGYLSLGRPPQVSLDDPKNIAGIGVLYRATGVLAMLLPAAVLVPAGGMIYAWVKRRAHFKRQSLTAALTWLGIFLAIAFLRWDPNRVAIWFGD
jgi:hypothetical protein